MLNNLILIYVQAAVACLIGRCVRCVRCVGWKPALRYDLSRMAGLTENDGHQIDGHEIDGPSVQA